MSNQEEHLPAIEQENKTPRDPINEIYSSQIDGVPDLARRDSDAPGAVEMTGIRQEMKTMP